LLDTPLAARRRLARRLLAIPLVAASNPWWLRAVSASPVVRAPKVLGHAEEGFALDAEESALGFRYSVVGLGELSARFRRFRGMIELREHPADKGAPAQVHANVSVLIAVDSVDTGNPLLDRIVMGPSLFDALRFPEAMFVVRQAPLPLDFIQAALVPGGARPPEHAPSLLLEGSLKIRDQDRKVVLSMASLSIATRDRVEDTGRRTKPTSSLELRAVAQTRISRSAFGVAGFAALVRDPIVIDLQIAAHARRP